MSRLLFFFFEEGGASQAVEASGLASSASLGQGALELGVVGQGLQSSPSLGTSSFLARLDAEGLQNTSTFGASTLGLNVVGQGLENTSTFGSSTSELNLAGQGLEGAPTFGTSNLTAEVSGQGLQNSSTFGTSAISFNLEGQGLDAPVAFGQGQLSFPQVVVGQGLRNEPSFGSSSFAPSIAAQGMQASVSFGGAALELHLAGQGLRGAGLFGRSHFASPIIGSGLASANAFGQSHFAAPVLGEGLSFSSSLGSSALHFIVQGAGLQTSALGTSTFARRVTGFGLSNTSRLGRAVLGLLEVRGRGIITGSNLGLHRLFRANTLSVFRASGHARDRVIITGAGLDMASSVRPFTDLEFWSVGVTGSPGYEGSASLLLDTGWTQSSLVFIAGQTQTNIDVECGLSMLSGLVRTSLGSASVFLGLQVSGTTHLRAHLEERKSGRRLRVTSTVAGQQVDEQLLELASVPSAQVRLLRLGSNVSVFTGGTKAMEVAFSADAASISVGALNAAGGQSRALGQVSALRRRPVVMFGSQLAQVERLAPNQVFVRSPGNQFEGPVAVRVWGPSQYVEVEDGFDYLSGPRFRVLGSSGSNQLRTLDRVI